MYRAFRYCLKNASVTYFLFSPNPALPYLYQNGPSRADGGFMRPEREEI